MKRLLSLAMAGMMLFSVPAFAATTTIDEIDQNMIVGKNTNDKYEVSYDDAQQGKEYMLWALKGVMIDVASTDFSQGNVLYVDQQTGGSDGVSYDGFLPMQSADSTLVITGQGMVKPVIIGYIKGEGNTISGNIGMDGRGTASLAGAVITFTSTTDASVEYTATTAEDGTFVIDGVADGTYKMVVRNAEYLSYTDLTFEVSAETVWEQEIELIAGDFNQDDMVGTDDFDEFSLTFGNFGSSLLGDFNKDGMVGTDDFEAFANGFGTFATVIR